MAATRERLEAVIRAQITRCIRFALDGTEAMNDATDAILREVDEYTSAELGLLTPAERRHILFEAGS